MRFLFLTLALLLNACQPETNNMGLLETPPTRERTYNDATPVDPNDLNAIQDAIIDGKHAELEYPHAAVAFTSSDLGGAGSLIAERKWIGNNAFVIACDLHAPVGTTITKIHYMYKRGTAGEYTLFFKRVQFETEEVIATVTDAVADAADHTEELVIDHEIESGWLYSIHIFIDSDAANNGGSIYGASDFRAR